MKKLEGVNLAELVEESSSELLAEKKSQVAALVKKELQKAESLESEIENLEKQIKSKKENLEKVQAKIKKIEEGDWSVLQEPKNDNRNKE